MIQGRETDDLSAVNTWEQHPAACPVAFAVTDGPAHVLRYANASFRALESAGDIGIGHPRGSHHPAIDLTPLLDRAFHFGETIRDQLLPSVAGAGARWRCSVWAISPEGSGPDGLAVELRDAGEVDDALSQQRNIAEQLLLGALREQDTAHRALEASRRAAFLASASRELSMSLDQDATRDTVAHRVLPREGTWCIVDIVESGGQMHRLAVMHPDPDKQTLARTLAGAADPRSDDSSGSPHVSPSYGSEPTVLTRDSGAALVAAAHGPKNLAILEQIGFGALLVVPLVVRGALLGVITFITRDGDAPFSQDEITLASELADRSAMALDNARLYRESDALRAAADEANHAKSAFLGNMSHELMTPLNAIGGYVELIDMGLRGPVTAEQRTDLARVKQNQQHLLRLISDILSFVRSESDRLEYHFATVPVAAALNDVAEMLEGAVGDRGLAFDRGRIDEDAAAWADPDRVRQILINLVMNAVKYCDATAGSIGLTSALTPDSVLIRVIDSGPGIPEDKLQTIFEPFVQLASGLTGRRGGVGLGLSISRDLARAMNGDLTVESAIGVGSTFTLSLPRAQSPST